MISDHSTDAQFLATSFMREAIRLAVENVRSGLGGPFGCVVVQDGLIIARGTNLVTSTNDPTAHAEIVAIRRACNTLGSFQLSGCDVYSSCEPCPMCLGALYWARPARLFFAATRAEAAAAGFDDDLIYAELPKSPTDRSLRSQRLLESEGREPFLAWSSTAGKIPY